MAQGYITVTNDQLNIGVFHVQAGRARFRLEQFRIDEYNYDTYEEALQEAEDYAAEVARRFGLSMVSELSGKVMTYG